MKPFSIKGIKERLLKARTRKMLINFSALAAFMISGLLLSWFVIYVLDYVTRFPAFIRILLTLINMGFYLFYIPYKKRAGFILNDTIDMAREVEERALKQKKHGFSSMLVSAVEFGLRPEIGGSEELKNSVIHDAHSSAFDPAGVVLYDKKAVKISGRLLAAFLAVYLLWVIFSGPTMKVFFKRAFGSSVLYPTRTRVKKILFPRFMPQYENIVIEIDVEGMIPAKGRAAVTFKGESTFDLPVIPVKGKKDKFTCLVKASAGDISMNIYLGDYKSDSIRIKVIPPPYVRSGKIKIFPPKYTGHIGKEEIVDIGHLKVIESSSLEIEMEPSKKVKECSLQILNREYEMKKKWGKYVSKKIPVKDPTYYSIRLVDKYGIENKDRLTYQVEIIEDELPFVKLIKPVQEDYFCPVSLLDWEIEAYDDYGLTAGRLEYSVTKKDSRGEDKTIKKGSINLGEIKNMREYFRKGMIDLNRLALKPNTDLIFQAKFYDRKNKDEADEERFGASEKILVHIVTAKKLRQIIMKRQDLINTRIEELSDDMEKDKDEIDKKLK